MQVCHFAKCTPKMIDLCYNEYSHIWYIVSSHKFLFKNKFCCYDYFKFTFKILFWNKNLWENNSNIFLTCHLASINMILTYWNTPLLIHYILTTSGVLGQWVTVVSGAMKMHINISEMYHNFNKYYYFDEIFEIL